MNASIHSTFVHMLLNISYKTVEILQKVKKDCTVYAVNLKKYSTTLL